MKKIILSLILFIIAHCTLNIEHCKCQWIYQSLPSYYEVKGIKFFDENTGIITVDVPHRGMLRTTNGGYNWVIIDTNILIFDIQKIDSVTMYAVGRNRSAIDRIQRTTNKGLTWDSITFPLDYSLKSLSFVNKDTGWISGFSGSGYVVWRTTNGGVTLQQQAANIGNGEIFFLKQKINGEYYGWQNNSDQLWRTTNSGISWFQVNMPNVQYPNYFAFYNENTGWYSAGWSGMYKTTNGGSSWVNQPLAPGIQNLNRSITKFIIIDKDTLYGINGSKTLSIYRDIGIIWKTTNGGNNWGYQDFDTTYMVGYLTSIDFINPFFGWAFQGSGGVHTTNCGGTIIFTNIRQISKEIPEQFSLYLNYPNPFNPSTNIQFSLKESGIVSLNVYNLQGKEIFNIINNKNYSPGVYLVTLNMNNINSQNIASGVFFYKIIIRNKNNTNIFSKTNKMIYLK